MNPIVRKHWTSLLGVLFVVAAFATLFRYSIDEGWLTDTIKVGLGLLGGGALALGGLGLAAKRPGAVAAEIVLGLGTCILYATFSFAGIYYDLWQPMTVLLGMTVVTVLLALYSYRYESRLLMNIALAGGLLSPLLMRPETDQVFTLFLYLLAVNAVFFAISILRGWSELRTVAFIGTWVLYAAYFLQFRPEPDGLWSMPLRYAVAAFLFYLLGFLLSSWRRNRCFDGLNLYLSLANGVLFGCWALYILRDYLQAGYTIGAIGLAYAAAGLFVRRLAGRFESYAASHGGGGLLLLLIAVAQAGSGLESKPLINVYLWGGIALALAVFGQVKRQPLAEGLSLAIWLCVGFYWAVVTWDAPRGEWFGVYIPFLNAAAVAWMLLAGLGFHYSMRLSKPQAWAPPGLALSNVCALLSHLIVGGLLTLQIVNVFEAYFPDAARAAMQLSLSVSWGVYALLLCLWGTMRRQSLFRLFGSVVLVGVAAKAILLDLNGEEALYKAAVLLVLGGISFGITYVNGRWNGKAGMMPQAAMLPGVAAATESGEAAPREQAAEGDTRGQ